MAKLFLTALKAINGIPASPGASASYFNPKQVQKAYAASYTTPAGVVYSTGTMLEIKSYDGTKTDRFFVSNAPSAVTALMNAANTTDVWNIPITIVPSTNSLDNYIEDINPDNIVWLCTNDQYTSDGQIYIQNATRSVVEGFRIDETAAAIAALANA